MRAMLSWFTLLIATMSWTGGRCASDTDRQQIKRVDGTVVYVDEVERYVAAVMDSAGVTGLQLAIINDGEVVYTQEFGLKSRAAGRAPDSETIFAGCSLSKPVFAHLVMQLAEEGRLDLDRPLVDYLAKPIEEYQRWADLKGDPRVREITTRRVLTHTTGWPNLRGMMEGGKLGFLYPPGERFSYSGEAFSFLQFIIEQITGTTIDVLARERIFIPLGMSRTSYVWDEAFEANCADGHTETQRRLKITRSPEADAGGSLVTTAADFSRFAAAVMGAQGLKQDSIDQMLAPQVRVVSKRMFGPLARETMEDTTAIHLSWGLGWGLFAGDFGSAFFHTGHASGWENYAAAYRNQEIGIVLLSNSSNFESIAERVTVRAIGDHHSPFGWLGFEPFDPSVPPPPAEPERQTVPIDSTIYHAVVGRYETGSGQRVELAVRNGRLAASTDGKYWDEVMALSETQFFIDGKPWDFALVRDSDGTVSGLIISLEGMEIPAEKTR